MAVGVPKELIQIEDYAWDAAFLQLVSLKLVKASIDLNLFDLGTVF